MTRLKWIGYTAIIDVANVTMRPGDALVTRAVVRPRSRI
jgi:hypothetical protein